MAVGWLRLLKEVEFSTVKYLCRHGKENNQTMTNVKIIQAVCVDCEILC